MHTLLSTKKLTEKNKVKLENSGFLVVEKNFIKTKSIPFSLNEVSENLIFTSKNAVKSVLPFKKELIDKSAFCVGEKTKKQLEKNGFKVIFQAENAETLANKISESFNHLRFTFFCGNIRKETLPNILKENQVELNEIVVYKTKLKSHKISIKLDGILFFSPSGIKSYLLENEIKNETCFCIGNTTAETLNGKTSNIIIAKKHKIEAVLKACIKYFKQKK
ncbi:uroporphyrinogen-III synthase [Flavobacterium okayamense]|uniref:Uroporphyrinogen III methyltransferase n=1 Tax=Flavobacterium okayamense TaxID=2830782 RepID=A0ABM7S300_9FLAO|nr:uroporphyrinogen-III synthase [Flavobacterium okayamense]BCY27900.1 uroporphyrinogen III methyltransferase [Flavobacterium okayamense]